MYVTYAKILVYVCDHIQQFYGNCQILSPSLINLLFKLCASVNKENLSHEHGLVLKICMCDSSAGIDFVNDKTKVIKRC